MNIREKRTEIYFKKIGCLVHTVSKPSRFGQSHDMFGLWDHIIVPSADIIVGTDTILLGETIYIQTKSRKQYGKDLIKYYDFPAKWKYLFIWIKNDKGRYELTHQTLTKGT